MDIVLVHLMLSYLVCGNSFSRSYASYSQINKENIRNCLEDCLQKYFVTLRSILGEENPYASSDLNQTVFNMFNSLNTSEFGLFSDDIKIRIEKHNDTVDISLKFYNKTDATTRKMKTKTSNMLQYMLVPGFLMAGILPWVMPGLNMAVMALGMINNMAFTSALFTMVRNYVFEKEPDEHVIYINHGYRNKKKPYR